MRLFGNPSTWETFLSLPATFKSNRRLLYTPLCTSVALLVSSIGLGYYSIAIKSAEAASTDIYKQSLQYLEGYEPIYNYIGKPYKVKRVQEISYTHNDLLMVVPVKGPKGRANLIINARRGQSNEIQLDNLEIELRRPNKRWTFFRQVTDSTSTPAVDATVTEKTPSKSVTVSASPPASKDTTRPTATTKTTSYATPCNVNPSA